jgi:hypothetical protein
MSWRDIGSEIADMFSDSRLVHDDFLGMTVWNPEAANAPRQLTSLQRLRKRKADAARWRTKRESLTCMACGGQLGRLHKGFRGCGSCGAMNYEAKQ